ncbi:MAG: flavodoxin-dependent (E)-4-hydroxy-3-methylbut-2-enyl-diphosphate synthase [Bacillota bacterium]|nr:flavodoxin-dependent (E)-4-hydroxy-3-methylbut-2-enyl-diphosphate synthase [Bacillota bacterium]
MSDKRMKREVRIGHVVIGGNHPVAIQSMCNTKTDCVSDTVRQIEELTDVGCEIVRIAVPDETSALAIKEIKRRTRIPLVADIHFDYRLALKAIENGIDKVRINPGNIGGKDRVAAVVKEAKTAKIPIRIGVNSGSVNRGDVERYGKEQAMVRAVEREVSTLEELDFHDIVIAVKSSDVGETLRVCQEIDRNYSYPMHIGITETGTLYTGAIKSAVGLGILLQQGIGQTMRVSLSADPREEIRCAKAILSSLNIRRFGVNVIACPTCGRTNVNVSELAEKLEESVQGIEKNLTVAVMGCAVNGPGEAMDADIGVAGGNGEYLLFTKGKILKKIGESNVLDELKRMILEY